MASTAPQFLPPQPGSPAPSRQAAAVLSVVKEPIGPTLSLRHLAPEAALRRLELTIVRRLDGYLQGDHLGLMPGPGSDLNDARQYVPGQDDVRRMDWAVTARTTVPHVRDTIADRELEVWALLDATPSMNWGTGAVTKRDLGIAAVATFGFVSQKMGDRFGGMMLHRDGVIRMPARSGRNALYALLRKMLEDPIETDRPKGEYDLAEGIEAMVRTQQRRGLRVVVSDFLTAGDSEISITRPPAWERPLRRLGVRNQVICVEVIDAAEVDFPNIGEVLVSDPESDFSRFINTGDAKARQAVNAATRAQRERTAAAIRRAGAGHVVLRTDRDWVSDIARFVLTYRRTAAVISQPQRAGGAS
ncbi:Uncharacterized conserved protein (some members contain a von Willebrand factor type A (vWA) domain) [Propionibacterium australiense]|uniref:DUF58 domain-containing protein n=1 Tax=Propionibacterium australiense TaxID=119981 RepID=A0A383S3C2_9ACTN|nr:Protein of unknown function DUF58 [Propionibacterium australiense]VEH90108.1 Uncharacterized conserved protein (some members contain a von Willebrand factor type A (vWA) domain) [Propionibacterium australiense]